MLANKTLNELISDNPVTASILHYLGVKFYDYSERTLKEVCSLYGLSIEQVERELKEGTGPASVPSVDLQSYPIDLVVEYLKHSHFIFIKKKLPYLSTLIEDCRQIHKAEADILTDLQTVFPMFVEDFIVHIYEEEDTLFQYIKELKEMGEQSVNPQSLYYDFKIRSVKGLAHSHADDHHEMVGLQKITKHYRYNQSNSFHYRVLMAELMAFDEELRSHAAIEDNILFPKAIALEEKIITEYKNKVAMN